MGRLSFYKSRKCHTINGSRTVSNVLIIKRYQKIAILSLAKHLKMKYRIEEPYTSEYLLPIDDESWYGSCQYEMTQIAEEQKF